MAHSSRPVAAGLHRNYVRKSDEFHRAAESAAAVGDWNAAVANAVHAGMSMADALCVFLLGHRSAARGHDEILRLMASLDVNRGELDQNLRHLSALLEVKNAAEYEERLLKASDASTAAKHTERFRRWASSKLPRAD